MKNKQQARLQISSALKQDDYDALMKAKDDHGVGIADIIREGINAINNKEVPSEAVIMEIVRAGIKVFKYENKIVEGATVDFTDTTPAES